MKEKFDVRMLAPTALLAATIAACNGGPATGSPNQTINPFESPNPITTQTPEIVKTPEQIARETIFSFWFNTLNNTQNLPQINATAQTTLENIDELNSQKDLLLSGGKSESTLDVSYDYGFIWVDLRNENQATIINYQGQLQIKDFQIKNMMFYGVSDADKANGIDQHLVGQVDYIQRFRANYYYPEVDQSTGDFRYTTVDKAREWLNSISSSSFPDFSDWQTTRYLVELIHKNGQWIKVGDDGRTQNVGTSDNPAQLIFPSNEMNPLDKYTDQCSVFPNTPCKTILINPPQQT